MHLKASLTVIAGSAALHLRAAWLQLLDTLKPQVTAGQKYQALAVKLSLS